MAYSESQKKASRTYNEKTYDRLNMYVPKGKRDIIKQVASERNMSLNEFVNYCIDKELGESQ